MARSERPYRLSGFGLTIESDRPIEGTCPAPVGPSGAADLTVETLPSVPARALGSPLYAWDGETLIFSPPGVAHYHCRRGGITIVPLWDADPKMISDLLVATALPAVIWLHGDPVLHAAAIVSRVGRALAIAGPSGIGKSTVASQLIVTGATLLADDSMRLVRRGEAVCVDGLGAGYHLATSGTTIRKFHHVAETPFATGVPIRAIAFLSWTEAAPSIVRLDEVGALELLLANQHRPAIPAILGRRLEMLKSLSFIASDCRMYHWFRHAATIEPAERAMLTRTGLGEWFNQ